MRNVFKAPLQSLSQLTRAVGKLALLLVFGHCATCMMIFYSNRIRQGLVLALQTKDEIKESLRLLGNVQALICIVKQGIKPVPAIYFRSTAILDAAW